MEEKIAIEIGRRLQASRKACGLTLREASEDIPGLGISALANYEAGTRLVKIYFIKLLARKYGVSAAWLMTLEEDAGAAEEEILLSYFRLSSQDSKKRILRYARFEQSENNQSPRASRKERRSGFRDRRNKNNHVK